MTDWLNKLDVSNLWKQFDNDEVNPQEVANEMTKRLNFIYNKHNIRTGYLDELTDVINQFEELSQDESATLSEFNSIMSDLYDWADFNHNCWIKTF